MSPTALSEAGSGIDCTVESPSRIRGVLVPGTCRFGTYIYPLRRFAGTCGHFISISFRARHRQNLSITPESRKGINTNPRRLERGTVVSRGLRTRGMLILRTALSRHPTETPLQVKTNCLPQKLQCSWKRIPKSVHQTKDLRVTSIVPGTTCTPHPKISL